MSIVVHKLDLLICRLARKKPMRIFNEENIIFIILLPD